MSLRYLLDTSTLSWAIAPQPNKKVVQKLLRNGAQCAIGAPVWHELTYGCERMPRGKRRAELESYLSDVVAQSFPVLPYDQVAASWHGLERARQEQLGASIPYVDGQIAAIARVNNLVLVTANAKDFVRLKDLEVEDWTRRSPRLKTRAFRSA